MLVGPLLRLAEAVLALNLDVVETLFESEPHDLGALRLGRAVGDQRQLDAQLLQPVESRVRQGTSTIPCRAARLSSSRAR